MAEEPNRMDGITDEPGGGADPQGGALESLRRGISAIQSVHEATRQHADARNASKQLSDQIAADTKTLEHREQIDRDFASIVSEQEAERAKASAALAGARSTAQQLEETIASLNDQLARMKQDHEESLRPYRELMESAKGRSDDAARSLSEARRAVKAAESQVADSAKHREQRIATANRAADNAQDRLRRVEAELTSLQRDPSSSPSAVSKMQSELVSEQAHLGSARDEVARVTEECRRLVDNAQTHLWTQRQSLETIENKTNQAKEEATAHREEYERLYNAAMDEEKALSDRIAQERANQAGAQRDADDAQRRVDAADERLSEAREIHTTPQVTAALRDAIAANRRQLDVLAAEIDRLAEREQALRDQTRRQRYVVFGIAAAAIILILLVVWLLTLIL